MSPSYGRSLFVLWAGMALMWWAMNGRFGGKEWWQLERLVLVLAAVACGLTYCLLRALGGIEDALRQAA